MNDITSIGGPSSLLSSRTREDRAGSHVSRDSVALLDDQVEISELARFFSRLGDLPDVRVEKIIAARRAIDAGAFETPDKLDIAVEKILDRL